jgi:hypothetical protein
MSEHIIHFQVLAAFALECHFAQIRTRGGRCLIVDSSA